MLENICFHQKLSVIIPNIRNASQLNRWPQTKNRLATLCSSGLSESLQWFQFTMFTFSLFKASVAIFHFETMAVHITYCIKAQLLLIFFVPAFEAKAKTLKGVTPIWLSRPGDPGCLGRVTLQQRGCYFLLCALSW